MPKKKEHIDDAGRPTEIEDGGKAVYYLPKAYRLRIEKEARERQESPSRRLREILRAVFGDDHE